MERERAESSEPHADPRDPLAADQRMPRWVRVFAVIAAVVVVLVVVMLLSGHGPGRHLQHGLHAPALVAGPGGGR